VVSTHPPRQHYNVTLAILILAGIAVAEPAAADVLARLTRRGRPQPDLL
jgi:hypothetical protein